MSAKNTDLLHVEPKQVVIPMQQHIGAPCTPLVKVGDRVLRGQKIGDSEGLCVPVHASVSGTVCAIERRPHPGLGGVMAVVIENDFLDETAPAVIPADDEDSILHAIREAGIVGMGGAAFPGNAKALSAMGNVDTMIANGCECEPYITADDIMLRTNLEQVLECMMILRNILHPERVVLAVEDNKAEAIAKIRAVADKYPEIELRVLPTRYPQGSEKQLIKAVTNREVEPGKLPVSAGCAVFNVSTFAAIYRAVKLGTPLRDLIEAAGGMHDITERVICGGPMMGRAQGTLDAPVIKATGAILCLPKDKNGAAENPVCLRCGKCVGVCPMHLQPLYMYRFVKANRMDELARLNIMDCMECGSCAFTCPGKLPLVERFRKGKQMVREASAK